MAAADLEQIVVNRLASFLGSRQEVHSLLEPWNPDAVTLQAVLFAASEAKARLASGARREARELLLKLISRITVLAEAVQLSLRRAAFMELAGLAVTASPAVVDLQLVVPCRMFRRAREVRLAILPGTVTGTPSKDPALIKLLSRAWTAREALMNGGGASLKEVAAANGCEPGYFTVLLKLGFLDPAITTAILNGLQPEVLTRQQLARTRKLPMEWDQQRRLIEYGRLSS